MKDWSEFPKLTQSKQITRKGPREVKASVVISTTSPTEFCVVYNDMGLGQYAQYAHRPGNEPFIFTFSQSLDRFQTLLQSLGQGRQPMARVSIAARGTTFSGTLSN